VQPRFPSEVRTVHLARHDDVGKQEIDALGAEKDKRRRCTLRFENLVAEIAKLLDDDTTKLLVVLDHQDAFASALSSLRCD